MTASHLQLDGYKLGHRVCYPVGTELIFSNLTPRKTYRKIKPDGTIFFGLQYFIKEYLIKQWNESFFKQPKEKVITAFKRRVNNYLGPINNVGHEHLEALHDLGFLPIQIMALKEGSKVPYKVAPMIIWNTKKEFFWLTNYLETILSVTLWPLATTATTAKQFRDIAEKYAMETVGDSSFVKFMGHNFSYRGCMGHEAAVMVDAGWLTSFVGSDSIPGIDFIEEYYNGNSDTELISCSVMALEHSTMCAYGSDNEYDAFVHIIDNVAPNGCIVSIISDSYDYFKVLTDYLPRLKSKILGREGKVVIRPDSGDNVKIIIGDAIPSFDKEVTLESAAELYAELVESDIREETPHGEYGESDVVRFFKYKEKAYKLCFNIEWNRHDKQYYYIDNRSALRISEVVLAPEQKGTIELLWEVFGGTVNEKGYKVLHPSIGAILGDGVSLDVMERICFGLKQKGFASTNMIYGVGSFSLQYGVSRDSDGYAVKSTFCVVNSEERNIFKNPVTDKDGLKKSAKGLIAVYEENGTFVQRDQVTWNETLNCAYELVFKDGALIRDQNFGNIRKLINSNF